FTHVPYKGGGPAVVGVVSGESQVLFIGIGSVLGHVSAGRLGALAVTSPQRSPLLQQVPTFAESGVKGMEVGLWFALLVPAGTPPTIATRLAAESGKLAAAADYREQLAKLGMETITTSGPEFSAYMRTEVSRWGKVIKTTGVKVE